MWQFAQNMLGYIGLRWCVVGVVSYPAPRRWIFSAKGVKQQWKCRLHKVFTSMELYIIINVMQIELSKAKCITIRYAFKVYRFFLFWWIVALLTFHFSTGWVESATVKFELSEKQKTEIKLLHKINVSNNSVNPGECLFIFLIFGSSSKIPRVISYTLKTITIRFMRIEY